MHFPDMLCLEGVFPGPSRTEQEWSCPLHHISSSWAVVVRNHFRRSSRIAFNLKCSCRLSLFRWSKQETCPKHRLRPARPSAAVSADACLCLAHPPPRCKAPLLHHFPWKILACLLLCGLSCCPEVWMRSVSITSWLPLPLSSFSFCHHTISVLSQEHLRGTTVKCR